MHERTGCKPMDSTMGPASFNYIHSVIIKRLSTYGTSQYPSQLTNTIVALITLGDFLLSGGGVRSNFGMNGRDATVFLPFSTLN